MPDYGPDQFAAVVDDWALQLRSRLLAIYKESIQRTVDLAQQYAPYKTGFLRASVRASIGTGNPTGEVASTIAQLKLGDSITIGWTAVYARRIEYGFVGLDSLGRYYNQAGQRFVGRAVMQWQVTVDAVVAEAKTRAGET